MNCLIQKNKMCCGCSVKNQSGFGTTANSRRLQKMLLKQNKKRRNNSYLPRL